MDLRRRRIGGLLITLGVLVWAPYFYALLQGRQVSIFPYLALHLAGVLSGAWLRRREKLLGDSPAEAKGSHQLLLSRVLIYVGVLAWAPYFYLKEVAGQDVSITPYLFVHLTGVLGGGALRVALEAGRWMDRRKDS